MVYGHNLNEGDIGVPGLIFINKRGIYKIGRTWSELTTKDRNNPSHHRWISRYGSVTFNNFGRDLPDGGMNEAGLYIWEMNEDADYPQNDSLPKLSQMNWMQYILDLCSTTDEAIRCASEIEIDGWGWHYFVGDAQGKTAAVAFIDGEVVIRTGETMPIPALFNTPYDRELELLKYYEGFGGQYTPDLYDPKVPRFVKTAVMIRDYKPDQDIVDYSIGMLDNLMVNDVPEWSILFDVREHNIYFKTRLNPAIKSFSMSEVDFSNRSPVLILNMDIERGGEVFDQFQPYTNEEMRQFTESLLLPIIPESFFTAGGITLEEYAARTSTHCDAATLAENQFFAGIWKNRPQKPADEMDITLQLETQGDAVFGCVSNTTSLDDSHTIDHLRLIGNDLRFTFITGENTLIEVQAVIQGNTMQVSVSGIEDDYGTCTLIKDD